MVSKTKTGALLFLLFACGYGWIAHQIPLDFWSQEEVFNARSLPSALALVAGVLALATLALPAEDQGWRMLSGLRWSPALALVVLMFLYGATLEYLGFAIATSLFLIGGFLILGERRPVRILSASIPLVLLFWLVMGQLGIYLDEGDLVRSIRGL